MEKGKFANGDLHTLTIEIKTPPPKIDDMRWEALPLETWSLEVQERMGSRDYISPPDMYGALAKRNAEIKAEIGWIFSSLGAEIKDKGAEEATR